MTTFSWLHLTDLHLGMDEQLPLLPTIKDRFFEDLKILHDKCGPWDFVLFTGDLTQKGSREEFKKVDEFLDRLWEILGKLGSTKPLLLAVPGNHDLVRPDPDEPEVLLLRDWTARPDVRSAFWKNPESRYRTTVKTAFANYVEWWEKLTLKPPQCRPGVVPGDFSAVVEKSGASLGIVGLNSTFLQLGAGDHKGKLAIDARQFQAVCEPDGPTWVRQHNACLLLTHQPPDWCTPDSQAEFKAEIAGYDYFAAHFFGHMHEARYDSATHSGASTLRACQGTSLFGLEYFGQEQRQDRRHGYSAGTIELRGDKGILFQWPRKANRPGGQWHFAADNADFRLTDEDHTQAEEFSLLKAVADEPVASLIVDTPPEVPRPFPNQWAVMVGINDYPEATKLHYCRQDVIDLAKAFRESLGFQDVLEFHEESELKPERDRIFRQLGDIRDSHKVKPDDLFVFYFSGHGINEGGRDYLLPIGARPQDVSVLGIRVQELAKYLKDIGCNNTAMFVDACRDVIPGAKGTGTASIGEESKAVLSEAGIIAFFSCNPKDRSYEIEALEHGSFTYCLLQAIREGAAETVSELESYLKENVPQINLTHNKNTQQPYAVIAPPERGKLQIFFNPHAQRFEPLIVKLISLFRAGKNVLGQLEFLDQVRSKRQLDESEKNKVALIESFCDDRMKPETFHRVWEGVHSPRHAAPQIKPSRLN